LGKYDTKAAIAFIHEMPRGVVFSETRFRNELLPEDERLLLLDRIKRLCRPLAK